MLRAKYEKYPECFLFDMNIPCYYNLSELLEGYAKNKKWLYWLGSSFFKRRWKYNLQQYVFSWSSKSAFFCCHVFQFDILNVLHANTSHEQGQDEVKKFEHLMLTEDLVYALHGIVRAVLALPLF